jgi:hypothetical protein
MGIFFKFARIGRTKFLGLEGENEADSNLIAACRGTAVTICSTRLRHHGRPDPHFVSEGRRCGGYEGWGWRRRRSSSPCKRCYGTRLSLFDHVCIPMWLLGFMSRSRAGSSEALSSDKNVDVVEIDSNESCTSRSELETSS